ncbi:MAG TPA: SDR family oxidoreductase [Flavobacteriales bacterium]|nr:SDR family oxidoreductase [Flavobacteriales bacterium]
MPSHPQHILITGAAGFIGSNLCEHFLELGYSVTGMDNFLTGKPSNIAGFYSHPNFCFVEGDIRDKSKCGEAMKGISIVLHQAALGSVPRSVKDPLTTNSVNVDGFLNVIHAAHQAGVKRFVYATSSSVYGDHSGLPKVEDAIGKPLSPYAASKYINELYAGVFHRLHGMEVIGLRYFNVFGKHQDPDGAYAAAIPKFIKLFLEGKSPVIYGDGSNSRDFPYIKNVIQANEKAAFTTNEKAFGEVFNIAFGERTTLLELITEIKNALSVHAPNVKTISVTHENERPGEIPHSLASIEKARNVLGYTPSHSLKAGLQEAVTWYLENI